MKKSIILTAVFALLLALCAPALAAPTLKAESLEFGGVEDGAAVFTLTVSGAQAIQNVTLKNETTGKEWSASSSRNLLTVKNSRGETANEGGRMTPLPVLMMASLTLIIDDAEAAIPQDSNFTATVTMIGGRTTSASAKAEAVAQPKKAEPEKQRPGRPGRGGGAQASFVGISQQDFVGDSDKPGGNGKKDARIDISFKLPPEVTVNGLKVRAASGGRSAEWDTVPGNGIPLVAITDGSGKPVNARDGIALAGGTKYALFVDDETGILSKQGTKITVSATLSDGRMIETEAEAAAAGSADIKARYTGKGKFDFAGQNEKPAPNMSPDSFIELSIKGSSGIAGISVTNEKNGNSWDTIPDNGVPAAVVLIQSKSGNQKLNAADGSISIPADKAGKLLVAFDEKQGQNTGPYKVSVLFDDGRIVEVTAQQGK